MDGMLFVAFFFPVIVMINFCLVLFGFLTSLYVGFGDLLHSYVEEKYGIFIPFLKTTNPAEAFSNRHPFFYPLLLNFLSIFAVVGTYGLGKFYHSKSGWSFYQPLKGGISFVLIQIGTWCCFALSLCFPWMTVDKIGFLGISGFVDVASTDPRSHAGLMLIGSIFSILAQTFAFFSLFAFDAKAERLRHYLQRRNMEKTLKELNESNWDWNKVFGGDTTQFWWMFVSLQVCITVYAGVIAFLIDMDFLKNSLIQKIVTVVFSVLLTITVSLTNSVGGKWRYGGARYHLYMPGMGGGRYVALQGFGWTSFAFSLAFTVYKMYDLVNATGTNIQLMRIAGGLGLLSELFLILSLFVFDPTQVTGYKAKTDTENEEEEEEIEAEEEGVRMTRSHGKQDNLRRRTRKGRQRSRSRGAVASKKKQKQDVERIIGKRPSPKLKGTIEYLVQWKFPSMNTWENQPSLLEKSNSGKQFILSAIAQYEQQLADMVSKSMEENAKTRAGKIISKSTRRNMFRSRSPPKAKRTSVVQEISTDEESDDMEPVEGESEFVVRDSKGDVWEECEDEAGNIFYINLSSGVSVFELPAVVSAR